MRNVESDKDQIYPEPTVGALIVRSNGDVLLIRSSKWRGALTVPGGHIELGETIEEALRREVKEEVGLNVEVVNLLLVQEAIYSPEFWKRRHFIFFDFLCRPSNGAVRVDGHEAQDYLWARPEEALRLKLDSFTKNLVEKYLEGERRSTG